MCCSQGAVVANSDCNPGKHKRWEVEDTWVLFSHGEQLFIREGFDTTSHILTQVLRLHHCSQSYRKSGAYCTSDNLTVLRIPSFFQELLSRTLARQLQGAIS